LCTFDTEYSADSVEWYPKENIFAVGTYQLAADDENSLTKSIRKGRIYLFKFDFESDDNTDRLKKLQQIETDAILDQKWFNDRLVVATSLGKIETFKYEEDLTRVESVDLHDASDRLALSVDVDTIGERYMASDSSGELSLIDAKTQSISMQWKAHDFEAWTCAFDRWNPNTVYSGEKRIT
jgi:diphthamide biosynthesis protein 7